MSPTVVGVDVGGTKVAAGVLRDGVLSSQETTPTDQSDSNALVDQLAAVIRGQIDAAGDTVAGVGLGVPSVIDFASGRVRSTVNLPLRDVPLRELLRERLELPVYVDNDATYAALAEAHDDEGRLEVRDLVMFTIGTGVGGGIVIGGRIYRGATGAAGELGHHIIGMALEHDVPEPGTFPQHGSLEALAAGRALDELARRGAAEHPGSALGRALAADGHVAGPQAVAAAHEGDAAAIAALKLLGQRLGIGIANAINIFDPEVVAIGGGVCAAGELLVGPARTTAQKFVLPGVGTRTEIRLARSGAQAGLRGAALLAVQELEFEQQRDHRSTALPSRHSHP
jgi:glucokinase